MKRAFWAAAAAAWILALGAAPAGAGSVFDIFSGKMVSSPLEKTADGWNLPGNLSIDGATRYGGLSTTADKYFTTIQNPYGKIVGSKAFSCSDWSNCDWHEWAISDRTIGNEEYDRIGAPALEVVDYLPVYVTDYDPNTGYYYGVANATTAIRGTYVESTHTWTQETIWDCSAAQTPDGSSDLILNAVYSGHHVASGLVLFEAVDDSLNTFYLYSWSGTGSPSLALMLGCTDCSTSGVDGTVGNQNDNTNILTDIAELYRNGSPMLAVGEYNIQAAGVDDLNLWVSSDGTTWTREAVWNEGAAPQLTRHIHGIYPDPYHTDKAIICFGDTDEQSGIVYWDTDETLASETAPKDYASFATDGAIGMGDAQRWRWIAALFDSDYIYGFSDTSAQVAERGIWRIPRTLTQNSEYRVESGALNRPYCAGGFGVKLSNGTMVFNELDAGTSSMTDCTVNTSTDAITASGHGMSDGDSLVLEHNAGSLPTGVTDLDSDGISEIYYVANADTDTFQLSKTFNGAVAGMLLVDFTAAGSNVRYRESSPKSDFWTSATGERWRWDNTGTVICKNAGGGQLKGLFVGADGLVFGYGNRGAGKADDFSTYIFKEGGRHYEKYPTVLHPVYWVKSAAEGGSDSNSGNRPTTPKLTVGSLLTDDVPFGSRIYVDASALDQINISPSCNVTTNQGWGPVVIDGQGVDETTINATGTQILTLSNETFGLIVSNLSIDGVSTGSRIISVDGSDLETFHASFGGPLWDNDIIQVSGSVAKHYDTWFYAGAEAANDESVNLYSFASAAPSDVYMENFVIFGNPNATLDFYSGVYYRGPGAGGSKLRMLHGVLYGVERGVYYNTAETDPIIHGVSFMTGTCAIIATPAVTLDAAELNHNLYLSNHSGASLTITGDTYSRGNNTCPAIFQTPVQPFSIFTDPASGDFTPIGNALNNGPDALSWDADNKPRPQCGQSDIGPEETGNLTATTVKIEAGGGNE